MAETKQVRVFVDIGCRPYPGARFCYDVEWMRTLPEEVYTKLVHDICELLKQAVRDASHRPPADSPVAQGGVS